MQSLSSGGPQKDADQPLIPQTTAGGVRFGWGYEWTPRTHIGLDALG
jgi:hypothetical protein